MPKRVIPSAEPGASSNTGESVPNAQSTPQGDFRLDDHERSAARLRRRAKRHARGEAKVTTQIVKELSNSVLLEQTSVKQLRRRVSIAVDDDALDVLAEEVGSDSGAEASAENDPAAGDTPRKQFVPRRRRRRSVVVLDAEDAEEEDKMGIVREKKSRRFLFSIEDRRHWDLGMAFALVFVVFVTPFEVGFLKPKLNALFVLNRCIDLVFIADMVLSFFTPFLAPWHAPDAGTWVADHGRIARNYLRGWFLIDLISVLPFDSVAVALGDDGWKKITIVRVVRLCRLAKLARILRAGRLLKRWEAKLTIRYSSYELLQCAVSGFVCTHWIACMWRLVLEWGDTFNPFDNAPSSSSSWLKESQKGGETTTVDDVGDLYATCFYWAITTISTIGYGDAANPVNTRERIVAILCMVVGSSAWAYILCCVTNKIAAFGAEKQAFHQQLDELTGFCRASGLPVEKHGQLREYFFQRQQMKQRTVKYRELIAELSPQMQGTLSAHIHRNWLPRVQWISRGSRHFIAEVTLRLEAKVFMPQEQIHAPHFYVINRGVCIAGALILSVGESWGVEHMLLTGRLVHTQRDVRALSFVEVSLLTKAKLEEVLNELPEERSRVRAHALWMALRRGFVQYVEDTEIVGLKCGKIYSSLATPPENTRPGALPSLSRQAFAKLQVAAQDGATMNVVDFRRCLNNMGMHDKTDIRFLATKFEDEQGRGVTCDHFLQFCVYYSQLLDRQSHVDRTAKFLATVNVASARNIHARSGPSHTMPGPAHTLSPGTGIDDV